MNKKAKNILVVFGVLLLALLVYNYIVAQRKKEDEIGIRLALAYWDFSFTEYVRYFRTAVQRFVAYTPESLSKVKPSEWIWTPQMLIESVNQGVLPEHIISLYIDDLMSEVLDLQEEKIMSSGEEAALLKAQIDQNVEKIRELKAENLTDSSKNFLECADTVFDLYIWPAMADVIVPDTPEDYEVHRYVNNWVMHIAANDGDFSMRDLLETKAGKKTIEDHAAFTVWKNTDDFTAPKLDPDSDWHAATVLADTGIDPETQPIWEVLY